jgi:F-box interacting protein
MVKIDWPNPYQVPYRFIIHGTASVNGFFCIEDCGRVGQNQGIERGRFVLWNPATDECKVIAISPFAYKSPRWDPYIEFHGFGYDQVNDDYKVIRHIYYFRDSYIDGELWEIYCLKSNCWRKLDLDMPTQEVCCGGVGVQVYTDGVCHWWNGNGHESEIGGEAYLVSFDLNSETFVKTYIPSNMDYIRPASVSAHLGMLNGSICWIARYGDTCTFHISILGEVGIKESWIKLLIVGPLPCVQYPIGIGKKGDIFFWRMDNELVLFNLNTQKIEELGVKGADNCRTIIYKESFLSFERINN